MVAQWPKIRGNPYNPRIPCSKLCVSLRFLCVSLCHSHSPNQKTPHSFRRKGIKIMKRLLTISIAPQTLWSTDYLWF